MTNTINYQQSTIVDRPAHEVWGGGATGQVEGGRKVIAIAPA